MVCVSGCLCVSVFLACYSVPRAGATRLLFLLWRVGVRRGMVACILIGFVSRSRVKKVSKRHACSRSSF